MADRFSHGQFRPVREHQGNVVDPVLSYPKCGAPRNGRGYMCVPCERERKRAYNHARRSRVAPDPAPPPQEGMALAAYEAALEEL